MDTCSRSWAVQASPQAARCSKNMLLEPYKKITKDSTNSADGTLNFRELTIPAGGLKFHAQPCSTMQPIHRPRVSKPYQKKMPPLMVCASPLSTLLPRWERLAVVHSTQEREKLLRTLHHISPCRISWLRNPAEGSRD